MSGAGPPQILPGLQGGVVWALVLYENEAPFRLADHAKTYADISALARSVRDREIAPEFTISVGAKIRPVLILQDRPQGRLPEYAALKLTRLEKLAADDIEAIRSRRSERFFDLPEPRRFGIKAETAVDLLALTRVHQSAIVSRPRGKLNANEFRVICERLVDVLDLDIAHRVVREASALMRRQGWSPPKRR